MNADPASVPLDASLTATGAIDAGADAAPGNGVRTAARRARFRAALDGVTRRSTAGDLLRWILIPAALAVLVGFNLIFLGWWGASRTHRQVEQIPYLISGGLIGLALVFVGGLLLASAFWIVVIRKLADEADARTRAHLEAFEARMDGRGTTPTAGGAATDGGRRRRTRPLTADSSTTS